MRREVFKNENLILPMFDVLSNDRVKFIRIDAITWH